MLSKEYLVLRLNHRNESVVNSNTEAPGEGEGKEEGEESEDENLVGAWDGELLAVRVNLMRRTYCRWK